MRFARGDVQHWVGRFRTNMRTEIAIIQFVDHLALFRANVTFKGQIMERVRPTSHTLIIIEHKTNLFTIFETQ